MEKWPIDIDTKYEMSKDIEESRLEFAKIDEESLEKLSPEFDPVAFNEIHKPLDLEDY